MSKSTNQSLLLLSIIYGSFKLIDENLKERNDDIDSLLKCSMEFSEKVIRDFQTTGNEKKNFKWIQDHLQVWKNLINEEEIDWPNFTLITIAGDIIEDLISIIKDKAKLESFIQIRGYIQAVTNIIDTDTIQEEYRCLDIAVDCLHKLYRIIGFSI